MHIGIVGRGRLGTSLERLLVDAGASVDLVGRERPPNADIVLLAVPDDAIEAAARALPPGPIVLHASGTAEVDRLAPHHPRGSFHPLMTFPGPERLPELEGVAAAVAGDERALVAARALAGVLGMRAIEVPGDRRLYHAAAVLSGNFATVLLHEASRALAAAGVPLDLAPALLAPLALQSLRNAVAVGPVEALTGPAARGDVETLRGHREALEQAGLSDLLELYDAGTNSALRMSGKTVEES